MWHVSGFTQNSLAKQVTIASPTLMGQEDVLPLQAGITDHTAARGGIRE